MHIAFRLALALALPATTLQAQATGDYLSRYRELSSLRAVPGRIAAVNNVTLVRDAGRLHFTAGHLQLLSPVGGRTVGMLFRGTGRFTLTAPDEVERQAIRRFADTTSIDMPFTEAVLLFADSTMAQLAGLTFGDGDDRGIDPDWGAQLVSSLRASGDKEGAMPARLIEPMLNGNTNGMFMARLGGETTVLFSLLPDQVESVRLERPVGWREWGSNWRVVTQFAPRSPQRNSLSAWMNRERLRIPRYVMDVRLTESFNADLVLHARAELTLHANEAAGPWLSFGLHPRLDIDSAYWGTEPAPFFKADDYGVAWVRAPRPLAEGDSLRLTLYYHGDMIDRYSNFFYVDPGADWYPTNGQGGSQAIFDLTFRSPARYPLVSIGALADSSVANNVRTTRWVTRAPVQFASFNLGLFQPYYAQHPGAPPVDVFMSEEAHNLIRRRYAELGIVIPEQSRMRENTAVDVSNSLVMFTQLFGPPLYERFIVTEIPYPVGVSFPGLISMSWGTFQNTSIDGFDEFFRAHETAHQWFGNGVRPSTYRDAWLSEGLATYAGIWYLQALKRRDNEYNRFLDQYQSNVQAVREAGPVAQGFRLWQPREPGAYHVMVYEKGAWIFHMLRVAMMDLNTLRPDAFTAMLRDYYTRFAGRSAGTEQFQSIVERHLNADMGWFFDQWVRGTALPTYRVAWRTEPADGGRVRLRLRVRQEGVPATFRMPVLVAADLGGDRTARFRVTVSGAQEEYLSPLLPSAPRTVRFNDMRSVLATVRNENW